MIDSHPRSPRDRITWYTVVIVALLMAVGLVLRVAGLGRQGLWLDEIFSASYTNLSLLETVVACLRFDVHPPLYYLQLNAWSTFGHSDIWLMLNSVLWAMATLVLVFVITARRFGISAGVAALAFCAVLGSEIYFSNELRAYAMLGTTVMVSWLAADRFLRKYRFRDGIPLILLLVVIGGLHSFGVIAVCGVLLYVLPSGDLRQIKRLIPTWFGIASLVGIGVLPWMVNASLRHVGHLKTITVQDVVYTVSGWILGYGAVEIPPWVRTVVALLIVVILVLVMRQVPRLRRMIVCFIVCPMLLTAVVCALWKPIWLFRPFSFCAPLLAVALGAVVGPSIATGHRSVATSALRAGWAGIAAAALIATGWLGYRQSVTPWKTQYREAAAYLRSHVQAGDMIYIPDQVVFWGVARYLVGPQWGSMLKVQDPLNQDRSAIWPGIYRRLGPRTLERLHLKPQTRRVAGFRAPMFIGWSPLPELRSANVVWLAGPAGLPYEFNLGMVKLCPYSNEATAHFRAISVFRIVCDSRTTNVAK